MPSRLKTCLALALTMIPNVLFGQPLESFQTGLLGDGYGYSVINGLQSEMILKTTKEYGKSTFSKIPNEKISADTLSSTLSGATAFRASPDFYIIGQLDGTIISHTQEARIDGSKLSSGANNFDFNAKAVYESGAITIGGKFGLLNFSSESRELKTAGKTFKSEGGWTSIPQLELLGGYKWKNTTNMMRFKFFSQGEFEVETLNGNKKIIYDGLRKVPAELSLSSLQDINHKLQTGLSIKFIGREQASQTTDEWSVNFRENGQRIVGSKVRDKNTVVVTGGGKFFPTPTFAVAFSASYETSGYKSEETSSFEDDNFGGIYLNFSSDFIPNAKSRIHASTGYRVPKYLSYKQKNTTSDVLSHQNLTTGEGSNTKTSFAEFSVSVGGTYMF